MGKLRSIGLFFQSAHGWLTLLGLVPSVAYAVFSYFEERPWSEIIFVSTLTLTLAMIALWFGLSVIEMSLSFLSSRRQRIRIASEIEGLRESGVIELSTDDVAAVWAGTRDSNDITKHLKFRRIKSAIDHGEINNPIYKDLGIAGAPNYARQRAGRPLKANIHTWISIDEVEAYFGRIGVL